MEDLKAMNCQIGFEIDRELFGGGSEQRIRG